MNQELSKIYAAISGLNLAPNELAAVSLAIDHAYLLGKSRADLS